MTVNGSSPTGITRPLSVPARGRHRSHAARGVGMTLLLLLCLAQPVSASHCGDSATVAVQILGSGGPELSDGLASSGYLIWVDGKATVLVDAGPGTPLAFERAGADFTDLQAIVFSHLHVDHSAGLPALVKGSYFTPRRRDLRIFGPDGNEWLPDTGTFVRQLFGAQGLYPYLSGHLPGAAPPAAYSLLTTTVSTAASDVFAFSLEGGVALSALPVHHGPLPALTWRVDVAGHSVVFSGDTNNQSGGVTRLARGVDLLVAHNAIPEQASETARHLHMRPSEIARLAAEARPRQLVLSHFMERSRVTVADTLDRIRRHYPGSIATARDLDCFPVSAGGRP